MCIHTAILCNQTMYKKTLGHYMPKQSSATWVTDILEPRVLEVSVHDTIWEIHRSSGS
jgi:hypothetical protein